MTEEQIWEIGQRLNNDEPTTREERIAYYAFIIDEDSAEFFADDCQVFDKDGKPIKGIVV